jgi:hypothetical protein
VASSNLLVLTSVDKYPISNVTFGTDGSDTEACNLKSFVRRRSFTVIESEMATIRLD